MCLFAFQNEFNQLDNCFPELVLLYLLSRFEDEFWFSTKQNEQNKTHTQNIYVSKSFIALLTVWQRGHSTM